MIDTLTILFTTIMVLIVAVRAVVMDRQLPWVEPKPEPSRADTDATKGRIRGNASRWIVRR